MGQLKNLKAQTLCAYSDASITGAIYDKYGNDLSNLIIDEDELEALKTRTSALELNYYQLYNYIENTSSSYIDTGFTNTANTTIDLEFKLTDSSGDRKICGYYCSLGLAIVSLRWRIIGNTYVTTSYADDTNRNTFTNANNSYYINGSSVGTVTPASGSGSMYLFAIHRNSTTDGNCALMKLYRCRIYDNGTLVRDFRPCQLISDITADLSADATAHSSEEIGLWDMVNDKFYSNVGSGTFTIG